jgi:alpha-glucosidase
MHWSREAGGGFTQPGVSPWLPLGAHGERNVADQRVDPRSTLSFVRDALALRRSEPDLGEGAYRRLEAPEGVWAWRRGEGTVVAVNLSDAPAPVEGVQGRVRLGTRREREGEEFEGRLDLGPWEGVVA